jgi:hypothetical protein
MRYYTGKERSPDIHHYAPLLHHVSTPIGSLHDISDFVGQRNLSHVAGKVGSLGNPVAERAAEAMWHGWALAHAIQESRPIR